MLTLRSRDARISTVAPAVAAFEGGARVLPREAVDPLLFLAPRMPSRGLPVPLVAAPPPPVTRRGPGGAAARFAALALAASAPTTAMAEQENSSDAAETIPDGAEADSEGNEEDRAAAESPLVPTVAPAPHPLSYEGDLLWEGIAGMRVLVVLRGGTRLTGLALAHAGREVAMAREPDGDVVRVPKDMVAELRVLGAPRTTAPGERSWDGKEAIAAGAILTIMGGSFMGTSGLIAAVADYYYGMPLMFLGSTMLGPGIPLLVGGADAAAKYEAQQRKNATSVGFSVSPKGVYGSLSFRF